MNFMCFISSTTRDRATDARIFLLLRLSILPNRNYVCIGNLRFLSQRSDYDAINDLTKPGALINYLS